MSAVSDLFEQVQKQIEAGDVAFSLVTVDRAGRVTAAHGNGPAVQLLGALDIAKDRLRATFNHGEPTLGG